MLMCDKGISDIENYEGETNVFKVYQEYSGVLVQGTCVSRLLQRATCMQFFLLSSAMMGAPAFTIGQRRLLWTYITWRVYRRYSIPPFSFISLTVVSVKSSFGLSSFIQKD